MTKRRSRRVQASPTPGGTDRPARRRTGLRILVFIAIVGLVLVSVGSFASVTAPVPTAIP